MVARHALRLLPPLLIVLLLTAFAPSARAADPATVGPNAYATETALLQQRVAELSTQVEPGLFPFAVDDEMQLRSVDGINWNSGFWAATLWGIADLTGTPEAVEHARNETIRHFGFESTRVHDQGFMYGESSVAAHERLCEGVAEPDPVCWRFRRSGLRAAQTLVKLSKGTGQKIIPMTSRHCSDCARNWTETIVDSMMNLPLLYWAGRETGQKQYATLAKRHTNWIIRHLQRKDGSTFQAGRYRRSFSAKRARVIRHTHQGLSNTSVWARGQAWSIYGFAMAGEEFRNRRFLSIAERNARWAWANLPPDRLPLWDYRAHPDDLRDVSAGVITAAAMFHLARACKKVKKGCRLPGFWADRARRVLSGSLARIRLDNPTGFLGDQAYAVGGRNSWYNNSELMFGINYALEAITLARTTD